MDKRKRDFLRNFAGFAVGTGFAWGNPKPLPPRAEEPEEDVAPAEDLMREHGVLNRILLIYDFYERRLREPKFDADPQPLRESAEIIRDFIENYHERLEEDHLFPRFEKANKLADLTATLRTQHKAGRVLTESILGNGGPKNWKSLEEKTAGAKALAQFIRMYRPHEAREDTVLFPALRSIISAHEYGALGEDFEKLEHKLFGKEGFEGIVVRVGELEKKIGIYELSQFTPKS
jgi:hemerythrin-like domain-containing protein